jgi:serine/threonine-protein kinase
VHGELVVESGPQAGERFVIRLAQRFLIGRGQGVSIQLENDLISRRHAELDLRPDGWLYIRDLGSRNGTFYRGERLRPHTEVRLSPGDRLELGGDCVVRVEIFGLGGDPSRTSIPEELELLPPEEFEILGEIGEGATGKVYAAKQKLLDRTVAVKVFYDGSDLGVGERERFMREGRTAIRIRSPYVVEIFDVRLYRGRVCLIMELVNGPSLFDRLEGGSPILIPEALALCEDVARALDEAHAVGVIHRDVKPGNVLLTPEGTAKLGDFGLAKDTQSQQHLTDSNLGMGSLPYVSPEQAAGANRVDERSDIYSLGATLFHLIGGRPPFVGSKAKILLSIVEENPPALDTLHGACPEDVVRFVHAALEKDPEARPPNAKSVVRQLRELRELHYPEYVAADPNRRTSSSKETRASKNAEIYETRVDAAQETRIE